jgi:hypothetical protein
MLKQQLLSIISQIRKGATSPQNIADSLEALSVNPPYGGTAITTTLPTVLAQGEQIIYRDPNGVQSLWIGNADGEAWPAVGYKEYVALVGFSSFDEVANIVSTLKNDFGTTTISYISASQFAINFNHGSLIELQKVSLVKNNDSGANTFITQTQDTQNRTLFSFENSDGSAFTEFENYLFEITIRL